MRVSDEGMQVTALALGYIMADALHAAAKLGIADLLTRGPRRSEELAAATDTHAPSLYRMMRVLCSAGVFAEDGEGRFVQTPLSATLVTDAPGSVRSAVSLLGDPILAQASGDLLASVRTGKPAFDHIFGKPFFEYLAADPGAGRIFDAGMANFSDPENEIVAKAYSFPANARVIELGGGRGGFLAEILKANPTVRGVLFDQPQVVSDPARIVAAGVNDRCEKIAGDFFRSVPPGGDAYVIKRVLHDWDDDTCIGILRRCRAVMGANARLLIIDAVIPPGNDPHPGKLVDIMMLTNLPGRERTEAEFREMLRASGFALARVITTPTMVSIVEGAPA